MCIVYYVYYWLPRRPFILTHLVPPLPPAQLSILLSWTPFLSHRPSSISPSLLCEKLPPLPSANRNCQCSLSGRVGGTLARFWNHVGCSSPTVTHGRTICFLANYHKKYLIEFKQTGPGQALILRKYPVMVKSKIHAWSLPCCHQGLPEARAVITHWWTSSFLFLA